MANQHNNPESETPMTVVASNALANHRAAAARPAEPEPRTLVGIHQALCKPFSQALIELKPGALTKDKARGLAMPYVDMRSYYTRLDRVAGPDGWSSEFIMSERGVVCRLTILGVTKSALGDFPLAAGDENAATSAEAQSFKRACSAFGLGRYLYSLAQQWADYDEQRKVFKDPAGVIAAMYRAAGIAGEKEA